MRARWLWLGRYLVLFLALLGSAPVAAQPALETADKAQQATADKFLQIFLNRPQTGTALTKTIEHYQSIGKFEELLERIKSQAAKAQEERPDEATRHWLAAALMVQTQTRWLESLELLQQVPDSGRTNRDIAAAKSVALEQLQRWPDVISVLQPLIEQVLQEQTPGNAEAVIELAQRLARAYARVGQSEQAFGIWKLLEKRFGNDQQVAMRLANMAANEGELRFAVEVLDRIVARMPASIKRVELVVQRIGLLARSGDEETAITQYRELLGSVNADSWLASDISRRIDELIVAKDGVTALIETYRAQVQAKPDDMKAMLRLAMLLDSEERWEESRPIFLRLIERTATAIEPRAAYAQSLIHQQRFREASVEFEKLAELAPRDEDVRIQWCDALISDTSLEAADRDARVRQILERSLKDAREDADSYQRLASRLQRYGQNARALEWLAKAYAVQPSNAGLVANYARALADAGREKESLEILARYQSIRQTDRDALAQLADLYHDLGQADLARETLIKACQLGATTPLRFRLAEWFEQAGDAHRAEEQLELAWAELGLQTRVASEQEALLEEITRRQILLARQSGILPSRIDKLRAAMGQADSQASLAGLPGRSVVAWRLARFLFDSGDLDSAAQSLTDGLKASPASSMLWRLQAQIDEAANRLPEAVAAYRKLADLDARRRSEYILQAARNMARMDMLESALKLTDSITTETASSELIIDVFNLANEHGATKFAIELLNKRLLSRPGDMDVLSRLIQYYNGTGALQQAATLQWQALEMMRTAEQRDAAVRQLIDIHSELRSLPELERKLDKFWRRNDLWREFGVWQASIAIKSGDLPRSEQLLGRLMQSQQTRRFALEQSLELARQRKQSLKQFQLMKQLAAIDPQSVTSADIAEILVAIGVEHRSPAMAQDAVAMMQGPSKRLALVEDLLLAAHFDWVLRIIEVLPEQDRTSWPIVVRASLASASCFKSIDPHLPHLQSARQLMDRFVDQSLDLPSTLDGQRLLEELFRSQGSVARFLTVATIGNHYAQGLAAVNPQAVSFSSRLQAYQAVVAAQFHMAKDPEERRTLWDRHRTIAMQQASVRERSVRLAALATGAHWQAVAPNSKDVADWGGSTVAAQMTRARDEEFLSVLQQRLQKVFQDRIVRDSGSTLELTEHLAWNSRSFQYAMAEIDQLADQGDSLAALLSLWVLTQRSAGLAKEGPETFERATRLIQTAGDLAAFAPGQLVAMTVLASAKHSRAASAEQSQLIAKLQLSPSDQRQLVELIVRQDDPAMTAQLIDSLNTHVPVADLLGGLLSDRTLDQPIRGVAVLRVLDAVWKNEVTRGMRRLASPTIPASSLKSAWIGKLPYCALPMHESSLFKQVDFALMRAILLQSSSNAARQEILQMLKTLSEEAAEKELRIVRQLARVFAYELLEQDTQSARLLDEALPPVTEDRDQALLRGLWLDVTGRRDAAIEWWLKIDEWPAALREPVAIKLLTTGLDRHNDLAIETAVKLLRETTGDFAALQDFVPALIKLGKIEPAELLLSRFQVVLPPALQPASVILGMNKSHGLSPQFVARWQQTDQLFVVLQRYSRQGDVDATCRVARRLVGGVNQATDAEIRAHLGFMAERLTNAIFIRDHLIEFLERESERISQADAPLEALCILRLIADADIPALAEPILAHIKSGKLTALQHYEIANCELKLRKVEAAAASFVQAFEREPEWLESSIQIIGSNRYFVQSLGKELNKSVAACTGAGRVTLDTLLYHIDPGTLHQYDKLLLGWAASARPKSLEQMHKLLDMSADEDTGLLFKIIEQLLLTEDLQPMTVRFESVVDFRVGRGKPSHAEALLLSLITNPTQREPYIKMLESVASRAPLNFTARWLLARIHLSTNEMDKVSEDVRWLLQCAAARSTTKNWVMEHWNAESQMRDKAAAQQRGNASARVGWVAPVMSAGELDRLAKVQLLYQLVTVWPDSQGQDLRLLLLEYLSSQGMMGRFTAEEQTELLRVHAERGDETKVLSLLEADIKRVRPISRDFETLGPSPISAPALKVLSLPSMRLTRHIVLVRAAQLEAKPLEASRAVQFQLSPKTTGDVAANGGIAYPLIKPDEESLRRFVQIAQSDLASTHQNSLDFSWSDAFKPHIVFDRGKNSISTVSLLDAIWPLGTQVSDDELRERLLAEVQSWSKDLDSLDPWSVLVVHNLAARLEDLPTVKRCQERLIKIANRTDWKDARWLLANWSAMMATEGMPELGRTPLQLGEIARRAATQDEQLKDICLLMMLKQADKLLSNDSDQQMKRMLQAELESVLSSKQVPGLQDEKNFLTRFRGNLMLFERLLALGESELAIHLLEGMIESGMIYGRSSGIAPRGIYFEDGEQKTLESFQQLIDSGWQPARLQRLLEQLLLEAPPRRGPMIPLGGRTVDDFADFDLAPTVEVEMEEWKVALDPAQPLTEQPLPNNMYSQLVRLARQNQAFDKLESAIAQRNKDRVGDYICGAMVGVEQKNMAEALRLFSQASSSSGQLNIRNGDLKLISLSLLNALRLEPLSESAIEYSVIAMQRPVTPASLNFLRQQFYLAARQKKLDVTARLIESLTKSRLQPEYRQRMRVALACDLLDLHQVLPSMDAYMQLDHLSGQRAAEPDRYLLTLMNRLPGYPPSDQAELFERFVSQRHWRFPWLECYALPALQPLPARFRSAASTDGLVLHALQERRAWVGFVPWIVEYAQRTQQVQSAIDAATFTGTAQAEDGWGASALTAQLSPNLTPAALMNRLKPLAASPTRARMQALLDGCQHSEALRSAAVEFILNLGYPEVALAPSANAPLASSGWKHWLTLREVNLVPATERVRWTLARNGQWTAQASKDKSYLMLRYPIEGDFDFSVTAQQVSGTKFGIGYGGLAAVQSESASAIETAVRGLGVGDRRFSDAIPSGAVDQSDVPLKITRQGSAWSLQAATARIEEQAADIVPWIYLINQGPGVARLDNWQVGGELKIAPQVSLIDNQMRLWRTSLGNWKLPALKARTTGIDITPKPNECQVQEGVLQLPALSPFEANASAHTVHALHCLRPLLSEESISYEFFHSPKTDVVHAALGRMVFRFSAEQVQLQWLAAPAETDWLDISQAHVVSIPAPETVAPITLQVDQWNKLRLTRGIDDKVEIELNGRSIARVPLPQEVDPEFGIVTDGKLPAKVRNLQMQGNWPKSLTIQQLTESD